MAREVGSVALIALILISTTGLAHNQKLVDETHDLVAATDMDCRAYEDCQALRGISIIDLDITGAVESVLDQKADHDLSINVRDLAVTRDLTDWFVCEYGADLENLRCRDGTSRSDFDDAFLATVLWDTRHVRIILQEGVGAKADVRLVLDHA